MDASRFAVVLGIFAFLIGTTLLANKIDPRFNRWTWIALLGGVAAARLGHVALNWQGFVAEPWRILALWQGGFYWPTGFAALGISIVLVLRPLPLRLWALVPIATALFVWNGVSILTGQTRAIALPPQAFETMQGQSFEFGKGDGKPRVVNLWASWCPPCRREMPMMAELAATSTNVEFVFANQGEGRAAVDAYLKSEQLDLGQLVLDQFSDLSRHYGAPGLPATLFIGADGVLKSAHLGEISRETLQDNINRLTDGH